MKNTIKLALFVSALCLTIFYIQTSSATLNSVNVSLPTVRVPGGTGFIAQGASGKKYIITNWHICSLLTKYDAQLQGVFDNGYKVHGKVIISDPGVDLCAAQIDKNLSAVIMADVPATTEVFSKGYPGGVLTYTKGFTKEPLEWDYEVAIELVNKCPKNSKITYYSNGSTKSCIIHWNNTLTSLFSRPGSSGSPVVDDEGQLVGVINSHDSNTSDYAGGMVSFQDVKNFLNKL